MLKSAASRSHGIGPNPGSRLLGSMDLRHERVTAPGGGCDVARSLLSIAERLPQICDMEPQASLLNRDAGPHPGQQIAFADQFVRTRKQHQQNVVCTSAELDALVMPG